MGAPHQALLMLGTVTNSYAGAWGLYHVRKENPLYGGSALRVRRSSDNAEQDIGFVGTALDTTALLAFTGAGSGFVVKWYDQMGLGHDFGQTATGKQPRIVNAGVYDTFVRWDGTDDCLTSVVTSGTPSAFTVFVNGSLRSTSGTYIVLEHGISIGTSGQNEMVYYNGNVTAKSTIIVSEGANYYGVEFGANFNGTVHTARANRAAVTGPLKNRLYVSGVEDTTANNNISGGSLPTANYTARTWNMGARNDGATLAAPLQLVGCAIYEIDKSDAEIAALSTIFA
jgi:hypothetical protein